MFWKYDLYDYITRLCFPFFRTFDFDRFQPWWLWWLCTLILLNKSSFWKLRVLNNNNLKVHFHAFSSFIQCCVLMEGDEVPPYDAGLYKFLVAKSLRIKCWENLLMRTSRKLCNPDIHICVIVIDLMRRVYIINLTRGVYDLSKDHKHLSKET